jgi:hypothetical protein
MLCVSVYILFLFVQSFYMAPQPRAFTFWFQQLFVEERTKLLHSMSQMSLASLSTSGSSKAKAPILNSESLRINSQQLSSTVMNSHCSRHVQTAVALCYMLLLPFRGHRPTEGSECVARLTCLPVQGVMSSDSLSPLSEVPWRAVLGARAKYRWQMSLAARE